MTDENSTQNRRLVAGMLAMAALATFSLFGGVEAAAIADTIAQIGELIAKEFFSEKWIPITRTGGKLIGMLIELWS